MSSRDHSTMCEVCGVQRGGLNALKCLCDLPEAVLPETGNSQPTLNEAQITRAVHAAAVRALASLRGLTTQDGHAIETNRIASAIAKDAATTLTLQGAIVVPSPEHDSVAEAIELVASHALHGLPLSHDQHVEACAKIGKLAVGQLTLEHGCPVHSSMIHGGEAQELRCGIETILDDFSDMSDMPDIRDSLQQLLDIRDSLQQLLDRVDARDSLAYMERSQDASTSRVTKALPEPAPWHCPVESNECTIRRSCTNKCGRKDTAQRAPHQAVSMERFPRSVTCAWCKNRYRSAVPSYLDRGLQGSHCASNVVQKDGQWFVRGSYGSDEHDMHNYLFVANPPSAPADPVCDECVSQRLAAGDLQDTGLEVDRRPSDFSPRPSHTGGLVQQIRELAVREVVARKVIDVAHKAHALAHKDLLDSCDVCAAIREYHKFQRWCGEIDDGGEKYAKGCAEVAALLREASSRLQELAAFWERKIPA